MAEESEKRCMTWNVKMKQQGHRRERSEKVVYDPER